MHKFFNALLVLTVLVSGFFLYSLEHQTRELERQIARRSSSITGEQDNVKFLQAEWSSLTRPDRLKQLAQQYLGLETLKPQQIVRPEDLARRVPAEPIIKLEADGSDPIGAIIDKMQ